MEAASQPTATVSRRKWLIIAIVALAVAAASAFLHSSSQPHIVITGAHVGGNVFTLTNHSDEVLWMTVMVETQTNGQWIADPRRMNQVYLAPHDSRTSFFGVGTGGSVVPSQPWRLHGLAAKQLHGIAARWRMFLVYVDMRRHGRTPQFNPFVSNDRVTEDAGEFFTYPASERPNVPPGHS